MARSKTPETQLRNSILEWMWVKYPMIEVWAQKNQGTFDPRKGIFRKPTKHFRQGVSDLIGVFPNGIFLAIEVKCKYNKSSPEQVTFLKMVGDRGGVGILAYSVEDVEKLLNEAIRVSPFLLQSPDQSLQALSSMCLDQ